MDEQRLASHPHLGAVEPLLAARKVAYRNLVIHRHYKLIYSIDNDTVRIVALWDTRRNPDSLLLVE